MKRCDEVVLADASDPDDNNEVASGSAPPPPPNGILCPLMRGEFVTVWKSYRRRTPRTAASAKRQLPQLDSGEVNGCSPADSGDSQLKISSFACDIDERAHSLSIMRRSLRELDFGFASDEDTSPKLRRSRRESHGGAPAVGESTPTERVVVASSTVSGLSGLVGKALSVQRSSQHKDGAAYGCDGADLMSISRRLSTPTALGAGATLACVSASASRASPEQPLGRHESKLTPDKRYSSSEWTSILQRCSQQKLQAKESPVARELYAEEGGGLSASFALYLSSTENSQQAGANNSAPTPDDHSLMLTLDSLLSC